MGADTPFRVITTLYNFFTTPKQERPDNGRMQIETDAPPRFTSLRIRGLAFAAARAFIKERFGPRGWEQLLASLDERSAGLWDGLILNETWYPSGAFDAFLDQLTVYFGRERIGEQVGRRIASADVRNRIFIPAPPTDPTRALEDGARLWRSYVNAGTMTVVRRRPNGVDLALDNPGVHPVICGELLVGWGNETVTRTGALVAKNVHRCRVGGGTTCHYEVTWAR